MIKENTNIVLIGMPGCGKTTIGNLLAEKLNKSFIDVDSYIEQVENRTIPEIFLLGENYFRDIETKAVKDVAIIEGQVISTGGGVIKRKENIDALKENGVIIFIDRPVEDIASDVDTENRPLLKDKKEALFTLYKERYALYKEYCDYQILNVEAIDSVLGKILDVISK